MIEHLEAVVNKLNEITDTSEVWPRGLMHPGGPHRRLSDMLMPISIGEDEGLVFGRLIEAFRSEHAFIIGNAFGCPLR
jgi:hypothetical protein